MDLATLLAQYAGSQAAPKSDPRAPVAVFSAPAVDFRGKFRPNIEPTDELLRINALPRRPRPVEDRGDFKPIQAKWDNALRTDTDFAPCACEERYGFCIKHLNEIQAWALDEFSTGEAELGAVCKIGVGSGKTGLDVLLPMVRPGVRNALLLIKSSLLDQFIQVDFPQWAVHFRAPNLDNRYSNIFNPGRPTLHVYTYSEISHKNNTDLLKRLQPDMIIADEAQNLGNLKTSRTMRFVRYFEVNPKVLFVPLSGSLNAKGVGNNGHLYAMGLRDGSPLPINELTQKRWGKALDPAQSGAPQPIGALEVFCQTDEDIVTAIGRRVNETRGVISSVELSCKLPLKITTRRPLPIPDALKDAMALTRATGARPDGEEAETSFQKALWLREMACGFFYFLRFPNGEPEELILKWFAARKAWFKEIRDQLDGSAAEHLDSPALLTNAADRYYRGYRGKLATWPAVNYQQWIAIKDKVKSVQAIRWMDDHMLNDALAWAAERKAAGGGGIVWCEFIELGRRIAKGLGVDYYNGGDDWSAALRAEKGDRVVVCSIRGFGTGTNLQRFRRHLVTSNPASAEAWQQLLGRPHRQGQIAPVHFEVYRHTPELRSALEKALERAEWIEKFDNEETKLLFSERDF